MKHSIEKIEISSLVPHEGILDWHLKEIRDWIGRDGFQLRPIAVSSLASQGMEWKGRFLIHDGHHRAASLKSLGCRFIMCSVFDFTDPRIKIFDYDSVSIPISKEEVIERALRGKITPRYDKHFIEIDGGRLVPFHDNPVLEPEKKTSLRELV